MQEKRNYNNEIVKFWDSKEGDRYYDPAEEHLDIFWNDNSIFFKNFKKLDCENIIELACGRGRHVQKYQDSSKTITLVDSSKNNIESCKNRFKKLEKIEYYLNNGTDLSELKDSMYSSIFSYDAMVHFELFDIASYLFETYRVLKTGGLGLFHHSNCTIMPEGEWGQKPHARNFMSSEIFTYLASRAGLHVIEQHCIDWGGEMCLDCLTLLLKKD